MLKGIPASGGIAIGRALVIAEAELDIDTGRVENVQREVQRFHTAVETAKEQLRSLQKKTEKSLGNEQAMLFAAHFLMLDDPEMIEAVVHKIESEGIRAEYALQQVAHTITEQFNAMDNAYFRERAADVKDIAKRLHQILLGEEESSFSNITEPCILVTGDLAPSDTAQLDQKCILGIVTDIGGGTSHTAILAQSYEIPAVMGTAYATKTIANGDLVIIDADKGEVLVTPSPEVLDDYFKKQAQLLEEKKDFDRYKDGPSLTHDGKTVELAANIGSPGDLQRVMDNGAEGIGLFRTEFLYMDRQALPSEEDQFLVYKQVLETMQGKPVVIRTLDIGGDKKLDYLPIPDEMNPFLGYRAIRLSLDRKDLFQTQIRALLRASTYGNLKIMFPMIANLQELRAAKQVVADMRAELQSEDVPTADEVEIGMMIEVPAAAVISDLFAREVDFFSIGTNDLIQYTIAVDRMNEKISHLYEPFHPAVLRLIKTVIDNGHKGGIWVGMCGEMAADPRVIPLLIGMGLDEFSMSSPSIPKARKVIGGVGFEKMRQIAEAVLQMGSADEIKSYLASAY
ncbi:phosphoenolpyruvate--protein phosphotransferase [Brevibacillus sp. TJ4]|uniref:phosphoenolpyruvate--protein phosphotransferase n=1 Tax=Brevibacillus sp. TJ4 TaxID=3234853 RepID=UPI003B9E740D